MFLLASFCSLFLYIARYACKKFNKKLLNIKQKYRPNHNNGFGVNSNRLHIKNAKAHISRGAMPHGIGFILQGCVRLGVCLYRVSENFRLRPKS